LLLLVFLKNMAQALTRLQLIGLCGFNQTTNSRAGTGAEQQVFSANHKKPYGIFGRLIINGEPTIV
jgi:hypothetical protein